MAHADISLRFLDEHARLDKLFGAFRQLKKSDLNRAKQFLQEFCAELLQHMLVEEKIIFPVFNKKCRTHRAVTEKLLAEHQKIRDHLDTIRGRIDRGDMQTDRDEVLLQSALDAHERNEGASFYPLLDQCLSQEEDRMIVSAVERVSKPQTP